MRKRLVSIIIGLMIILTVTSIAKPEWFSKLQLSPQVDTPLPSGITVYAYGASGLVSKQKGTEVTYYHNDNLGSSAITTNSNGEIAYSTDYYPFGKAIHETGKEKYTYNGKELDSTGLYYYGARYYDASLGRFISVDPVSGNIYNGQRLNRYSYTLNNPLKYVDPSGSAPTTAQIMNRLETNAASISLALKGGPIYARYIPNYLKGNPSNVVDELLKAYNNYEGRIEINLFAAIAYREGLGEYTHDRYGLREKPLSHIHHEGWPIGVDYFFTLIDQLKNKNFLRSDYNEGDEFRTTGGVTAYEKGEIVYRGDFSSIEYQIEAMGALFLYNNNVFLKDLTQLGIDPNTLDSSTINRWSYVYYSSGEGAGRRLLKKYGIDAINSLKHQGVDYANQIQATQENLEKTGLFSN